MEHQYRENGAKNIYSNYNQMRAYAECSPDQSKKLFLIDLSIEQYALPQINAEQKPAVGASVS